jgi:hypothetical protein
MAKLKNLTAAQQAYNNAGGCPPCCFRSGVCLLHLTVHHRVCHVAHAALTILYCFQTDINAPTKIHGGSCIETM